MEEGYFSRNVKSAVRAVPRARKVISAVRALLELMEDARAVPINGSTRQLGKALLDLPPMHVINLQDERGHIRRLNIKEHVSKHGVEVVLSPAVDKNKIEYVHDEQLSLKMHKRKLELPEIALVQSHSLLYKKLLDSPDPYMLIAEDDICVDKTFKEKLSIVLSHLPDNFDIISFERGDFDKHRVIDKPNVVRLRFKRKTQPGSGLYLISKKGAKQILEKNDPHFSNCAADGAFHHCLKRDNVYATIPPLGWQSNEETVKNSGGRH